MPFPLWPRQHKRQKGKRTAGSRDSLCSCQQGSQPQRAPGTWGASPLAIFQCPCCPSLLCRRPSSPERKAQPQARIMRESDVGRKQGSGEAPGTAQSSVPVFQSSGDRGLEVTDHPTSVGLQPMGTRGPSGSDESARLCKCAVLVPSHLRAMNLSGRRRVWPVGIHGDMPGLSLSHKCLERNHR